VGYEDDNPVRYVIYARNISEFTRIAENLHLQEDYLRDLISNFLSLICECRNGVVRFINKAGLKLWEPQSEGEIIGPPIRNLFYRSCEDVFMAEFYKILHEGAHVPLRLK
jgi:hypothetical protein